MKLSHADVQEILKLLDEAQFTELRLETDEFRLWLRRGGDGQWTESTQVTANPRIVQAAPPPAGNTRGAAMQPAAREGLVDVRSPLPGTFYRSPQPGAPPFVEVGDEVLENTVVCIIETMKLMNSIPAGVRGRVREICFENAAAVAKEQVLIRIEPVKP